MLHDLGDPMSGRPRKLEVIYSQHHCCNCNCSFNADLLELALAKDSYLNSFVFNFDSKGQIINRLMTYAYYGYPADFLQKTKENVEKVTKADVLRVAKAHLRPDKLQILVVGRPDDLDKPLSTLGEVKTIDITIPPPKQ
jgi:hypothetical protein